MFIINILLESLLHSLHISLLHILYRDFNMLMKLHIKKRTFYNGQQLKFKCRSIRNEVDNKEMR